ncbi:MAG: flagellar hook-associated protein, partial [Pseudomonadota bacterium]
MQPTIFGSLNTGYSGLQVAQLSTQTVSTNIANADTEGYSRQRTIVQNALPLNTIPGAVGMGAQVDTIMRIHDEYVYNRLRSATSNKAYTGFQSDTLQEVAQYLPDMQNVGITDDLTKFFNAWQDYANSPGDTNQAIAVTSQIQTLSVDIKQTSSNIKTMQSTLNNQVSTVVDEINTLGAKIAELNYQINNVEAGGLRQANDLKDQRDNSLLTLNGLVNLSLSTGVIKRTSTSGGNYEDSTSPNYVIQIAGYPLVDGSSFHPLVTQTDPNSNEMAFNSVYFQRQDYVDINITDGIQGGKLGAILSLRGYDIGADGTPQKGELPGYINTLNTFANGLIQNVNDIYANSAMGSALSNPVNDITGTQTLSALGLNVQAGNFDYTVYDKSGVAVATRSISINPDTDTLTSVAAKFNASIDDNLDGNTKDDTNSFFQASFAS